MEALLATFPFLCGDLDPSLSALVNAGYILVQPPTARHLILRGFILLWSLAITALGNALVALTVVQQLRGETVNVGSNVQRVLARIVPLVLTVFYGFVVVCAGLLALIIPGLIAMTAFFVAIPACILDRTGPNSSLSRSADLTRSHRWPIFAVIAAFLILNIILNAALNKILGAIAATLWHQVRLLLVGAIVPAFWTVVIAVIYFDLRAATEGTTSASTI